MDPGTVSGRTSRRLALHLAASTILVATTWTLAARQIENVVAGRRVEAPAPEPFAEPDVAPSEPAPVEPLPSCRPLHMMPLTEDRSDDVDVEEVLSFTMSSGGKGLAGAIGLGGGAGAGGGMRKGSPLGGSRIGRRSSQTGGVQASGGELLVVERPLSRADSGSNVPEPQECTPSQGMLFAHDPAGGTPCPLVLERTEVAARVSGLVAAVEVGQRFGNPFSRPIEAEYVFPLPVLAAVDGFVMEVGGRRITGVVRERAEAERIYAAARAEGRTASLLTQERPNIFTHHVANIEPGRPVSVRITYFEELRCEDGWVSFVFPMVVGPRYVPGPAAGESVPAPPVLRDEIRAGHDIALTLDVDAGVPIQEIRSVTHDVEERPVNLGRTVLALRRHERILNRDFVVRWRIGGERLQPVVHAHAGARGGFFALTAPAPVDPRDFDVSPRELTFIVDVSGSMQGTPIELCRAIVRRALDRLRPGDLFNIVTFASGDRQLWPEPRPPLDANLAEARKFLDGFQGDGGTEMLGGLQRALAAHHDPARLQIYAFLTDGQIGNEPEILATVRSGRAGGARFFALGTGSSVNRHLLDGIGELGGGVALYALPRDGDAVEGSARRFVATIDAPVLVDVSIDWNGLPVSDVHPERLPDLFAGEALHVLGRYRAAAAGTAYLTGRVGSRAVRVPVSVHLPPRAEGHAALATLWARHAIHGLESAALGAPPAEATRLFGEATRRALEFGILASGTAFVAEDAAGTMSDGRPLRVVLPLPLPENPGMPRCAPVEPWSREIHVAAWGLTVAEDAAGGVRVVGVADGAARGLGLPLGAQVTSVRGIAVQGVDQLRTILRDTALPEVEVGFSPPHDADPGRADRHWLPVR